MEKGINLSLTKSLAVFDELLGRAIKEATSKKLSVLRKANKSRINPIKFDNIFDSIFSNKSPAAHEGADSPLSQEERDALLSGGDLPAAH